MTGVVLVRPPDGLECVGSFRVELGPFYEAFPAFLLIHPEVVRVVAYFVGEALGHGYAPDWIEQQFCSDAGIINMAGTLFSFFHLDPAFGCDAQAASQLYRANA